MQLRGGWGRKGGEATATLPPSSSSSPTKVGEGDRAKHGGGGAGLDETLSRKAKRRVRRPSTILLRKMVPLPRYRGRRISNIVLAMRFFASEVCGTARKKDAERF
jgi:hypothetical protein